LKRKRREIMNAIAEKFSSRPGSAGRRRSPLKTVNHRRRYQRHPQITVADVNRVAKPIWILTTHFPILTPRRQQTDFVKKFWRGESLVSQKTQCETASWAKKITEQRQFRRRHSIICHEFTQWLKLIVQPEPSATP